MVTLEKIKSMSEQDKDIGLNHAHYRPLANLINERDCKEIIEIGCAYGNLAEHLLMHCDRMEILWSVDPYKAYPQMPGLSTQEDYDILYKFVKRKMEKYDEHRLIRKTSNEFYGQVDFESVDLVFIDGLHEYEQVKMDIANYETVIRKGGILSGHDINIFEDVTKAVMEYHEKTNKPLHVLPGNIWYFEM